MSGVIIIAGHRRSLTAALLAWALCRRMPNAPRLDAVLCPTEFDAERLRAWRRRFGRGFLAKIFSEMGVSAKSAYAEEHAVFAERLHAWGVPHARLRPLCRELGVPLHIVRGLNHPDAHACLERLAPRLALFTGGGIVRQPFLDRVPGGVVNLHSAWLPQVRGLNAAEWSLFHGLYPAATLHRMDAGLDTGPILARRTVAVDAAETIPRIRARVVLAAIDLLIEILPDLDAGRIAPLPNPRGDGRQYYEMAPALKMLVQRWIQQGTTPCRDPAATDPHDLRAAPETFGGHHGLS